MMNVVGTVLFTTTSFIKLLEVGSTHDVFLYGRGNESLKIGNKYEITNLVDGGKLFKSFKTTEKTEATSLGSGKMIKIEGTVVRASIVKVELVDDEQSMCIYGKGYEHLTVGEIYEFSKVVEADGQQQVKIYRITAKTRVVQIKRERVMPSTLVDYHGIERRGDQIVNFAHNSGDLKIGVQRVEERAQWVKPYQSGRKEGTNSQSTSSQSNVTRRPPSRAMSGGRQENSRFFARPKGKTYRKSRYDPPEVDMNHPKWKEKLDRWKRRDTKCGGLSRSSRVRRDPSNLRLGSDRFTRPRPDRIYNC